MSACLYCYREITATRPKARPRTIRKLREYQDTHIAQPICCECACSIWNGKRDGDHKVVSTVIRGSISRAMYWLGTASWEKRTNKIKEAIKLGDDEVAHIHSKILSLLAEVAFLKNAGEVVHSHTESLKAKFRERSLESYEKRRREADAIISDPSLRKRIMERDGGRCVQCGRNDDLSIDHIIPVLMWGESEDHNLQTLCRPCNSAKGARLA